LLWVSLPIIIRALVTGAFELENYWLVKDVNTNPAGFYTQMKTGCRSSNVAASIL
jgi:hypothetical protein